MKKGRFEQPRNGHLGDPVPEFPEPGTDYQKQPDRGFQADNSQQSPTQNEYPENAYDSNAYDRNYCPPQPDGCRQDHREKSGIGWGILSFFFPAVGLILFLLWRKRKPRASRASGIGALTGLIATLIIVLGLVIGGTMYYNHMLDKVNIVEMTKPVYTEAPTESQITEASATEEEETTEPPATEPPHATRDDYINFLVVGQAARQNENERFADTMLICTLNKFDNSITVTSLLRDSFVQPPPFKDKYFGQIKLTTVYHMGSYYDNGNPAGSMELMNNTLFQNFGVEIDHNFEISFDVFTAVVDALDGVDMELTEAEAKYMTQYFDKLKWEEEKYNFEPGMAHLDGYMTLTFARMRKADGDGESDIKRTARQRRLMETLMSKIKTMKPSDLQKIANEVLPMVTTNMSKDQITDTLKMVLPMLPTMEFKSGGTCPENYSGVMVDIYNDGMYHSVLKFIPQETKKHMRELTLGETAD